MTDSSLARSDAPAHEPQRAQPVARRAPRLRIEQMFDAGLRLRTIAVETGLSERDIRRYQDGDALAEVEARLAEWLTAREAAARHAGPGFIMTPTAEKMFAAFDAARAQSRIVIVATDPGIGKTFVAKEWLRQLWAQERATLDATSPYLRDTFSSRDGALYVYLNGISTLSGALSEICEGLSEAEHGYRNENLKKRISYRIGGGFVLFLDEAQHLEASAVDGLRFIVDQLGASLVLLGNIEYYNKLIGDGKAARFAQIASRATARLQIQHPSEGDVDAILSHMGISGSEEREFSITVAMSSGALRTLFEILNSSITFAAQVQKRVDLKVMKSVAKAKGYFFE
jgi:hypothetical protein